MSERLHLSDSLSSSDSNDEEPFPYKSPRGAAVSRGRANASISNASSAPPQKSPRRKPISARYEFIVHGQS